MKDLKSEFKADMTDLKSELKADISRIDTRLNSMQNDLQHSYELKGHLEGRIDEIAKRVTA
jgi:ABC-type phosphate transport system auxiliary subunit